jgi:hypothetical protein
MTEFKFNPQSTINSSNTSNVSNEKSKQQYKATTASSNITPASTSVMTQKSNTFATSMTEPVTQTDNISVDGSKIDVYVDNYRRSGNNILIDVCLYNKTMDSWDLHLNSAIAYDSFGSTYSSIALNSYGNESAFIRFAPGVKIKTYITIKNVSNAVKNFSLIDLKIYLANRKGTFDYPHIKLKNCGSGYVGYTSSKLRQSTSTASNSDVSAYAKIDTRDLSAKYIGVRRSGNSVFVDLYITNKTPDDIVLRMQSNDNSYNAAYDQNGSTYTSLSLYSYGNKSSSINLAPNVKVRCVLEIRNVSNATTSIPLIKAQLQQFALGKFLYPNIEIKNINL